jgi:hypothetical protein
VRHLLLLLIAALSLTACGSKLGQPHGDILGQWKAPDTYGGDTWIFRDNGTFTAEGGRQKGAAGSGAVMQNLPRSGKWGVKDGAIHLDYATLSTHERPVYRWQREGPRLTFTKPGDSAPAIVLDRAN